MNDRTRVAHPDLGQTIELAIRAHEGQIDKSGRPYYLHPLRVAMPDVYDNMSPARTRALPAHERGMRRRFAKDAQRVLSALAAMNDALAASVIEGEL